MKLTIPINQKYQKPLAKIARSIADVLDPPSSRRERKPKPFSVLVSMAQSELTVKLVDNNPSPSTIFPKEPVGLGWNVTGARGATLPDIVPITSLADSGPGTFREAFHQRSNVFGFPLVDGICWTASQIDASGDNLTFWGHSAPGDGFAIASALGATNSIQGLIRITGNNQVWRHLTGWYTDTFANAFQGGGGNGSGIFEWLDSDGIWIDNCTGLFGNDSTLCNCGAYGTGTVNSTVSNSMMGFALWTDRKNMLIDGKIEMSVVDNVIFAGQDRSPVITGNQLGHVVEVVGNAIVDTGRGIDCTSNAANQFTKANLVGNIRLLDATYPGFVGNHESTFINAGSIGAWQNLPEFYILGNLDNNRTTQAQAESLVVGSGSQANIVGTPHAFGFGTSTINYANVVAALGDDRLARLAFLLGKVGSRSGGSLDSLATAAKAAMLNRTGHLLGIQPPGPKNPKIDEPAHAHGGIPTLSTGSAAIVTPQADWNEIGEGGFLKGELAIQAVRNL